MAKDDGLKALRTRIDGIDRELLKLLNERAGIISEVVREKSRGGLPPFDLARERRILERMKGENAGPLTDADIELIMDAFFKVFRSMGKPFTVAYFGPEGTFTHQAALRQFGGRNRFLACRTIEQVFREVEKERAEYGVVPIENSSEGVVIHTIDMFVESDLRITAEIMLEVHHYLLSRARSLGRVRRVFSHPQALVQCRNWLEEYLPRAALVESDSTAAAAQRARRDPSSASIGSEIAASLYGLAPLAERIEDFRENITRFLVIGRHEVPQSGADKTSLLFSVKDRVGALHSMLTPFKEESINLTRIESRPSKKKAWEYVFFVDLLGHRDEERVRRALSKLEDLCVFFKVLGSYPQA